MEKAHRIGLESIRAEFARAAVQYPDLFFEIITIDSPDPSRWEPRSVCQTFIEANGGRESRQEEWYVWKDGKACGRFHGNLAGVTTFKRLAESVHLAQCEIDRRDIDCFENPGFLEWLRRMFYTAHRDPTPLLRLKFGNWGIGWPLPEEKVLEVLAKQMAPPIAGRPPYPVHPPTGHFVHDVFTSAIAFVDFILDPETAFLLGDGWPPKILSQSQFLPDMPPIAFPKDGGEVKGETTTAPPAKLPSPYAFKFDTRKERWYLRFPGDEPCDFDDYEGLKLYARLLQHKGVPMNGRILYYADKAKIGKLPRREHVFTFADKKNFCRALEDLDDRIAAAKEAGRIDDIAGLESQRDRLYEQLGRDLDVHGNPQELGPPDDEKKARRAAQRVMDLAIKRIKKNMPKLAKYLVATCNLRGGEYEWCYRPLEELDWEF